ncbi:MAG: hypothetical protein HY606_05965 [Planctomycetes bacterium]|nr:hypothetical protein [Planctomycetota bacterium]
MNGLIIRYGRLSTLILLALLIPLTALTGSRNDVDEGAVSEWDGISKLISSSASQHVAMDLEIYTYDSLFVVFISSLNGESGVFIRKIDSKGSFTPEGSPKRIIYDPGSTYSNPHFIFMYDSIYCAAEVKKPGGKSSIWGARVNFELNDLYWGDNGIQLLSDPTADLINPQLFIVPILWDIGDEIQFALVYMEKTLSTKI